MDASESDDDEKGGYRVWGRLRLPLDLDEITARAVLRQHAGLLRLYLRRYPIPPNSIAFAPEDAHALGQAVLLEAHRTFNPDAGVAFATWAGRLLSQAFSDVARNVRSQTRPEQRAIMRARAGEELQPREAAAAARAESRRFVSLDRQRTFCGSEDAPGWTEAAIAWVPVDDASPEVEASRNEQLAWLRARLANGILTDQEKVVIRLELGGMSRQDAADHLGVSRQRVDVIHQAALVKLRAAAVRDRQV